MLAEVDGVFFRGDEGVGLIFLLQAEQVTNVKRCVLVMVAVKLLCDWLNIDGSQLIDELAWARDSAERNGSLWGDWERESAANLPDIFHGWQLSGIDFFGEHDGI